MGDFGPDLKESVTFEKYWDGHSLNDNCPVLESSRLEPAPIHYGRIFKEAEAIFKEFDQRGERNRIRIFDKGTIFDAKKFPEGTIIRFSGESHTKPAIRLPKGIQAPDYERWQYDWGVVCGFDYNNQRIVKVVRLKYYDPKEYKYGGYKAEELHDSVIRVGEVSHFKGKVKLLPEWQKLERIHSVELFQIGKGVRRQVQESAEKRLPGRLIPVPQKEN